MKIRMHLAEILRCVQFVTKSNTHTSTELKFILEAISVLILPWNTVIITYCPFLIASYTPQRRYLINIGKGRLKYIKKKKYLDLYRKLYMFWCFYQSLSLHTRGPV